MFQIPIKIKIIYLCTVKNNIFVYGESNSVKIILDSTLGCLLLEFDRSNKAKIFHASVDGNH